LNRFPLIEPSSACHCSAREGTVHWLAALRDNQLLDPAENVAGLTILTGGLYYGLQPAWQTVFGSLLPENFIGIKRHRRLGNVVQKPEGLPARVAGGSRALEVETLNRGGNHYWRELLFEPLSNRPRDFPGGGKP